MLTAERLTKIQKACSMLRPNGHYGVDVGFVHELLDDRTELVELLRLVRGYITKEAVTHYQPVDAGYGEAAILLSAMDRAIHSAVRETDEPPGGDTDG